MMPWPLAVFMVCAGIAGYGAFTLLTFDAWRSWMAIGLPYVIMLSVFWVGATVMVAGIVLEVV